MGEGREGGGGGGRGGEQVGNRAGSVCKAYVVW